MSIVFGERLGRPYGITGPTKLFCIGSWQDFFELIQSEYYHAHSFVGSADEYYEFERNHKPHHFIYVDELSTWVELAQLIF